MVTKVRLETHSGGNIMTDMERLNTIYTDAIKKYNRLRTIMRDYAKRNYGGVDVINIVLDNDVIYGCGSIGNKPFKFTLEDVYNDVNKLFEDFIGG